MRTDASGGSDTTFLVKRVLGLIPARGGSKGVPRKNIRLLGGKPLIQWTIDAARASKYLSRLIVSTDDQEIAELAQSGGAEVPFLRPAELAEDETPMLPVVQHAVHALDEPAENYDAICLLQPTNPFRTAGDIDGCIDLLRSTGADSVMTVLPVPHQHNPYWVYLESDDQTLHLSVGGPLPIPSRQMLPPAWHREGSVYVVRRDVLLRQGSLYGAKLLGYPMDPFYCANIDGQDDWLRAERMAIELSARNLG